MIRIIREGSQKYPWILKSIIGVIAVTFIGGMGWYGYEAVQPNTVATIGSYTVTLDQYRRAKQRLYRFYRDQLKQEDVDEEQLQQLALNGLIESTTWSMVADQFDLSISPEELHDAIVAQTEFHKDGKFDPQIYERLLQYNRMTPSQFEKQRTIDLIRDKARLVVMEGATLTPAEVKEAEELAARQAKEGEEPDVETLERSKRQLLLQKKQRAIQAFQTSVRTQAEVTINKDLL